MANEFCAAGIKSQTSKPFKLPVDSMTYAPQVGHEIAGKDAIQIDHKKIGTAGAAGPLKDSLSAALQRAQDHHSRVLEFARTSPPPDAACPSCGYDMIVSSVTPTFLRESCEDINYTCEKCGAELQRTIKSS
jgi:hypothetical protein